MCQDGCGPQPFGPGVLQTLLDESRQKLEAGSDDALPNRAEKVELDLAGVLDRGQRRHGLEVERIVLSEVGIGGDAFFVMVFESAPKRIGNDPTRNAVAQRDANRAGASNGGLECFERKLQQRL